MLLKNGIPCNHKGCLKHITHPCETCGRIGGQYILPHHVEVPIQDIYNLEKARLELMRMLEATEMLNMATMRSVTNPIWKITHTKYNPIIEDIKND